MVKGREREEMWPFFFQEMKRKQQEQRKKTKNKKKTEGSTKHSTTYS